MTFKRILRFMYGIIKREWQTGCRPTMLLFLSVNVIYAASYPAVC